MGRIGGGWSGAMGTVGGITRTYGLQDEFTRGGPGQQRPRLDKGMLRRVARYMKPYWGAWLIILGCIATASTLNVLPPWAVREILDTALPHKNLLMLGLLSASMVGLAIASGLVSVLQQTLTARTGQSIMFDLRNELYRHLQKMSLRFFTTTRSGEIVSRINNDVNAIQNVAAGTIVSIASNFSTLAVTAGTLFYLNWKLALMAVAIFPAFYVPAKIVGAVRRRLSTQTQEAQASLLTFLNERLHVGGSLLTNIYGQGGADAQEFSQNSGRVRDLSVRQAVVGRWLFMILSVFSALGPAAIYWYGGYQAIQNELTPGMLVQFAALLTLFYRPMVQLANVYVDIQASMAVFGRIFEYLDMRPDVQDKPNAVPLPQARGHIEFHDVSFAYPKAKKVLPVEGKPSRAGKRGRARPPVAPIPEPAAELADKTPDRMALRGLSFEIRPGERVALVGPSGAGKTTVTYLVPRFYDPLAGRITLDGHDLRDLAQADLRKQIGMVTQETFLFHATIRANLLYAKAGATDAEMFEACRAANIHEFIEGLPEGYDSIVGERGFRLSGGEKQRLSIARALLKNPSILILDEATSSLDATSEFLIQTALEKLLQGRTSLIIAHRLSTILSADKIVVMRGGQVVDIGRHAELLERRGLYAELFEQQFSGVLHQEQPTQQPVKLERIT